MEKQNKIKSILITTKALPLGGESISLKLETEDGVDGVYATEALRLISEAAMLVLDKFEPIKSKKWQSETTLAKFK